MTASALYRWVYCSICCNCVVDCYNVLTIVRIFCLPPFVNRRLITAVRELALDYRQSITRIWFPPFNYHFVRLDYRHWNNVVRLPPILSCGLITAVGTLLFDYRRWNFAAWIPPLECYCSNTVFGPSVVNGYVAAAISNVIVWISNALVRLPTLIWLPTILFEIQC